MWIAGLPTSVGRRKREARRRRPTCHFVQVLTGFTRPERGIFSCGKRDAFSPLDTIFCEEPRNTPKRAVFRGFCDSGPLPPLPYGKMTVNWDFTRRKTTFSPVKYTLSTKTNPYSCYIFSSGNNLPVYRFNVILNVQAGSPSPFGIWLIYINCK